MPTGVFIRTKEYKEKQRLAHIGKPNKGHFKKGLISWNTGKGKYCWCPECTQIYNKFYNLLYRPLANKAKRKKFNSQPWLKTFSNIRSRCYRKGHYSEKRIKNYLTQENLKFLWFRDKAYLMKKPSIDRKNGRKHYTLNNCRYIEYLDNLKRPKVKWKNSGL